MGLTIGLMSGTSLDGVDGVLAQAGEHGRWQVLAHAHRPFPAALRLELLALNDSGDDELHRAAVAGNALTAIYAEVVMALRKAGGVAAGGVAAIGAHGQTVRHRPGEFDGSGYTLQLINGALLAELTGIDVVCDFRSRDVAAGGQGAPLVPAFHAACFGQPGRDLAVLNLGGIANLTLLDADGTVRGFDTGPGNVLLDLWCQSRRGLPYDAEGTWASGGPVDADLLAKLRAEPYFGRAPPKSTGRDLFRSAWLEARLGGEVRDDRAVMSTLAELTASTVADALRESAPSCEELLVCGGGAFNADLLRRIASRLGGRVRVASTAEAGVPPDQVEALAFAWLAAAFLARQPGNLPAVTGARGPRVLGALYPAA